MNHEQNKPRPTEADVTDSVRASRRGRPGHVPSRARRPPDPREGAHSRGRRDRRGPPPAARWSRWTPASPLIGPDGLLTLLDAFEGRRQLIAYYFMWWTGHPAAEQCEGCTHTRRRSGSSPTCIRATSPTRRSARGHTRRASATATSWAGRCPGIPPKAPSTRCWADAESAKCTSLLPARRRQGLRDLLDHPPRRRGDGLQLRTARPNRLRPAGDLGGLARRLATVAGDVPPAHQRTSHRPVVPPASRTNRRARGRGALSESHRCAADSPTGPQPPSPSSERHTLAHVRQSGSLRIAARQFPGFVQRGVKSVEVETPGSCALRQCYEGSNGGASPQPQRGTGACSTTLASGCELCCASRVPHST